MTGSTILEVPVAFVPARSYTKEAFNLIVQSLVLSPRKVCELKWSRMVNTQGRKGGNIPCDLHMEHLNCHLKLMMSNLGSNISPKSVERMAKSLGVVHDNYMNTFQTRIIYQFS